LFNKVIGYAIDTILHQGFTGVQLIAFPFACIAWDRNLLSADAAPYAISTSIRSANVCANVWRNYSQFLNQQSKQILKGAVNGWATHNSHSDS